MDAIKEFFNKCITEAKGLVNDGIAYAKAYPFHAALLAGLAAFILIILIVIISLSVKRKKAKKRLAAKEAAEKAEAEALQAKQAEEEKAKAEAAKKEEERKAVEAKLEAQRIAAEKEAEEKALAEKAQKEAEEKALAEKAQKEAEEKALAEKAQKEAEEKALAEKAQKEAEEKALAEKAQKEAEEKALAEKAQKEAEEKALAEKAQKEAEEKALAEKAQKEAEEKALAEKAQKEAEEKALAEKAQKEAEEKALAEKAQKEAEEQTDKETATAVAEETVETNLYDELKDAEEEDDIWYDENETDKAARYKGKWQIYRVVTDEAYTSDDMYYFELHASNGERLLSSEEYTSYNGALRGIETHKTNILKGNFKITLSKKGDYVFKLLSGKNMLLCMGENYPTKARCERAIESTKRFAESAVIDENVQDHVIKIPHEDETDVQPLPEGYNGKWIVGSKIGPNGEKLFFFELFANNGEKLLASEDYTTYIGAVNGIQTHKTNIQKGNFRISLTKRGDYIYKLLNGNGQLLCLGEHYRTKRLCVNAVESVKRFALNSPLLTDSEHLK
ncbi:MAG: DUF1508 domain-containing protein [Clostridia bacterium]|nr:DUF1508 domain-containing protein [Clostridia bacterium]